MPNYLDVFLTARRRRFDALLYPVTHGLDIHRREDGMERFKTMPNLLPPSMFGSG
jgi:hypothetical protein